MTQTRKFQQAIQTDKEKEPKMLKIKNVCAKEFFAKFPWWVVRDCKLLCGLLNINLQQLSLANIVKRREMCCFTRLNKFCFQNLAKFPFKIEHKGATIFTRKFFYPGPQFLALEPVILFHANWRRTQKLIFQALEQINEAQGWPHLIFFEWKLFIDPTLQFSECRNMNHSAVLGSSSDPSESCWHFPIPIWRVRVHKGISVIILQTGNLSVTQN